MGFRWILSVLASLTIVFAASAGAQTGAGSPPQLTPEQIAKMPVRALPVRDFKLLSPNTGWVSTGNRLLFTTDNGAHWKDISPPNPNGDQYASVFFLDANTGWVLFSHRVQDNERPEQASDEPSSDWSFTFSFTADGGANWTAASLPPWHGGRGLSDQGVVAFADTLHGWLSLGVEGNTMTAGSALLLTSDGGRTWRDTPDAKEGPEGRIEAILARTEKDIWILATPEGGSALWATHDGGNSYQEISLSAPKEVAPADYPTYSLPVFSDSLNGYEAVTYSGGFREKSAAVLFATDDGGRTWKPDRILSNLDESSVGARTFSAVAGSTWIFSFAPQGTHTTLVRLHANDRKKAETNERGRDGFNNCELSFFTPDEGWMNCADNLSVTLDGGAGWTSIGPRTRNGVLTTDPITPSKTFPLKTNVIKLPGMAKTTRNSVAPADTPTHIPYVSGIDQHLGIDRSHVLSTDEMAKWWTSSPYYDVGIYALDSPNRGNDPTLAGHNGEDGIAWVDAVIGQGWGIIPIWFGLQAPCACNNPPTGPHARDTYPNCRLFAGRYSFGPDEAYNQGKAQASDAITSIQKLGLDGSIIYVDSEQYTSTKTCGAAARGYLSGFLDEIHKSGGVAGVYGGLYDVSNFSAADDFWAARADNHVTVWNLSHDLAAMANLPDTCATGGCWANKERIHQYRVQTYEKWGATKTSYEIDNDIVDARIVPGSGFKEMIPTSYTVVSMPSYGTFLYGINNGVNNSAGLHSGEAVGYYYVLGADTYLVFGFTYLGGTTTSLGENNIPYGINNLGQMVGGLGAESGFIDASGSATPQTLNYPGEAYTGLTGINDAGWIVGDYSDDGIYDHCFLVKPEANGAYSNFIPINVPGETDTWCWGINGLGQIAIGTFAGGYVDDAEGGDPNAPANFSPSPDQGTHEVPLGINNNGVMTGSAFIMNGSEFVGLQPYENDFFGGSFGLNDDVQIVGYAYDPDNPVVNGGYSGIIINVFPTQP
jgi:photosystem II stability/assembly factor-like uncharacterized protein